MSNGRSAESRWQTVTMMQRYMTLYALPDRVDEFAMADIESRPRNYYVPGPYRSTVVPYRNA